FELADDADGLEHGGRIALGELEVSSVDEVGGKGGVEGDPLLGAGNGLDLRPRVVIEAVAEVNDAATDAGRHTGGAGERCEQDGEGRADANWMGQHLAGRADDAMLVLRLQLR